MNFDRAESQAIGAGKTVTLRVHMTARGAEARVSP
jgi:hypothetical protein